MRKLHSSIPSFVISLLFVLGFTQTGFAQKPAKTNIFPTTGSAGIGTITPHSSALLEMTSTTQGFLPPRMLKQNMLGIVGPDRGLLVFVTDGEAPGYYYNNGVGVSQWLPLIPPASSDAGANLSLSNLTQTSINTSLTPSQSNLYGIGTASNGWGESFISAIHTSYLHDVRSISIFNDGSDVYNFALLANSTGANGTGVLARSENGTGLSAYSNNSIAISASGNTLGVQTAGGTGISTIGITSHGINATTFNTSAYAGYFSGSIYNVGSYQGSDKNLKQNIQDLSNAMDLINKLHPTQYEFRQDGNYKLMNMPKGNHYGLIAQEVEKVLPDLIKETKFDPNIIKQIKTGDEQNTKNTSLIKEEEISFKAMNYTELIPIMIKGMQELSKTNEEKDAAIKDLQKQIDDLKQLVKNNSTATNDKIQNSSEIVELKSISVLEQNTPNPFTNNTAIRYSLPDNKGNAFINFYSSAGVVLKSVKLNASGKGVIDVKASELASGIYQYSLVIDGKVIETKQMVRLK